MKSRDTLFLCIWWWRMTGSQTWPVFRSCPQRCQQNTRHRLTGTNTLCAMNVCTRCHGCLFEVRHTHKYPFFWHHVQMGINGPEKVLLFILIVISMKGDTKRAPSQFKKGYMHGTKANLCQLKTPVKTPMIVLLCQNLVEWKRKRYYW